MFEPQPLICLACGSRLRPSARFCAECGQTAGAPPAPDTPSVALPERPSMRVQLAAHVGELKRVGWLFGALLFNSFVLGMIARFDDSSPWPDAAISGINALITVGFVAVRWRELAPLLRLPRLGAPVLMRLLGGSAAAIVVLSGYFELLAGIGVPMLSFTEGYVAAGWPVWSMVVSLSAMPAVFEELAFRGVIQTSLERVFTSLEALLIQAALFSVLHLLPIIFPSHFLMGLWFGWVRKQTGSVYPGMLLHALWNAAVIVQELSG